MDSRHSTDHKEKRDEDRRGRKLFIGGVSFNTTDEDFFKYFAKYGELEDCVLIREKDTGQSRGFGFVTYKDRDVSEHVAEQQLYLDGRRLDPKPSISRYNMDQIHEHRNQTTKVFVGGLHDDTVEAELSEYFNRFGEVIEVNIMYDRFTNAPRGFGFVTFKECEVAAKVINYDSDHLIHSKKVDCKPATARKDAFKRGDIPEHVQDNNNKSTSREERWRRYHGDTDEHPGPGLGPGPGPTEYKAPKDIHSHSSSYNMDYATHSSYAHHPTPYHHTAPPYPYNYPAPPHAPHGYAPPPHYATPPHPHPHGYDYYRPPHYPPPTTTTDAPPPMYQRYDYYAQYHHPQSIAHGQGGDVSNAVDNGQSVVVPVMKSDVGDTKQTVSAGYGPSRGSKAVNSAQSKRYSAY